MAEEKELTPYERIQWLRERGVLIETPEERKAKAIAEAMKEAENIPADGNVRMEPKVGGRTTAGQQQRQASLGVVCAGKITQEVGYSWTQTEEELEISIILSREMTDDDDDDGNYVKSKEIQVQFKPQSVVVIYRKVTLLQLELFERVSIDGCTWMLDRQTQKGDNSNNNNNLVVVVTMEKVEQALWPRIQN